MKASSILLSLAAAAIASAQDPFYNITTPPFNLLIASEDHSINTTLSACHVGAALESLCLSNGNFGSSPTPLRAAEFQFNTSIYSQTAEPPILATGILTWWLRTDVDTKYSSSASFSYDPTTDLALPIIFPGEENAILLSWDAQNKLTIQSYIRGVNGNGSYKNFYRCLLSSIIAILALAQANYNIAFAPFNLVLIPTDTALKGDALSACHTSVTASSSTMAKESNKPYKEYGTRGTLTWFVPLDPYPLPSSMYLDPQTTVPLSIPVLARGDVGELISFDNKDLMNIQSNINWESENPRWTNWKEYYRWWVC
ncbi:hypothetical protein PTNB73_03612 [Pyrenophora teres f. teres]|nr:hypothetical protein PTNB85_02604 [Pyrenophora teres f. teres]KAE8866515.1 hypothetical protein PTNB29_03662 [Pyrenophora teres f. teres]KAE8872153.1 hypothetical protein PTNB73_03612 [Pyrenophora teres f. teres]